MAVSDDDQFCDPAQVGQEAVHVGMTTDLLSSAAIAHAA
jgi:hypothetical protein